MEAIPGAHITCQSSHGMASNPAQMSSIPAEAYFYRQTNKRQKQAATYVPFSNHHRVGSTESRPPPRDGHTGVGETLRHPRGAQTPQPTDGGWREGQAPVLLRGPAWPCPHQRREREGTRPSSGPDVRRDNSPTPRSPQRPQRRPLRPVPAAKCSGLDFLPAVSRLFTFSGLTSRLTRSTSPFLQASKSSRAGSAATPQPGTSANAAAPPAHRLPAMPSRARRRRPSSPLRPAHRPRLCATSAPARGAGRGAGRGAWQQRGAGGARRRQRHRCRSHCAGASWQGRACLLPVLLAARRDLGEGVSQAGGWRGAHRTVLLGCCVVRSGGRCWDGRSSLRPWAAELLVSRPFKLQGTLLTHFCLSFRSRLPLLLRTQSQTGCLLMRNSFSAHLSKPGRKRGKTYCSHIPSLVCCRLLFKGKICNTKKSNAELAICPRIIEMPLCWLQWRRLGDDSSVNMQHCVLVLITYNLCVVIYIAKHPDQNS